MAEERDAYERHPHHRAHLARIAAKISNDEREFDADDESRMARTRATVHRVSRENMSGPRA